MGTEAVTLESGVELHLAVKVCKIDLYLVAPTLLLLHIIVRKVMLFIISEILCSSLNEPENGIIMYSLDILFPFDLGTTATYVCNVGFGLSDGVGVRTCTGDGSNSVGEWTETQPNCFGQTQQSL